MGAQKDHRAPAAWPRPKRSDAVLLLVLCAFGIAAKVVMTGLDALTGESGVQIDTTSDEYSDATSIMNTSNDWWQITLLIHTTKETWETQAAAVKATWLGKPLPPGVRYFWVSEEPLPGEPAILVSDRLRPGLPKEPDGANNERVVQSLIQVLKNGRSYWYIKVNDNTYVDLAAVTPQSLASLQAPQENPYYLGDCACSWEDGISRCNELKYFDCSVFADEGSQEAVTGLNEAVTSRSRGGYACGGPGYILSYAAVKQFVDFEQDSGAARGLEDMMIGEATQRQLGTTCEEPPVGTFAFVTLRDGETSDVGLKRAQASKRTLGTMYRVLPDMMRTLHQQVADLRTGNQDM